MKHAGVASKAMGALSSTLLLVEPRGGPRAQRIKV
jgi:hypothetical protein